MIHSLIPFTQLTRRGMPEFRVCNKPLLLSGAEIAVGEVVAVETFPNRVRVRQLYEQRRIEPTIPPKNSRQEARERMERAMGRSVPPMRPAPFGPADVLLDVSTPLVEDSVDFEENPSKRPGGYVPRRGIKR